MTDRVKRKLRKRKLNYAFRVFSEDHWDAWWHQPTAINQMPLQERTVQTGTKMSMSVKEVKRYSKQPHPPASDAARALNASMAQHTTGDVEAWQAFLGRSVPAQSTSTASSSAAGSTLDLAFAGGAPFHSSWNAMSSSGASEQKKRVVAAGGALLPARQQPSPAPHMDRFVFRPKPPPMHGSVARAPPIAPPAERVKATGSAAIASVPWAQSHSILPSVSKFAAPKGPPPPTRWLDRNRMEWA